MDVSEARRLKVLEDENNLAHQRRDIPVGLRAELKHKGLLPAVAATP